MGTFPEAAASVRAEGNRAPVCRADEKGRKKNFFRRISRMKWIWLKNGKETGYAEFRSEFSVETEDAELKISADRQYAAWVNGRLVCCGQYTDVPAHKAVDSVSIAAFVRRGKNTMRIAAYHADADFSVARTMEAGVAFEVYAGGQLVVSSGEGTLCRAAEGYTVGDIITLQLGYGWGYDFCREGDAWQPCEIAENAFREEPRPVPPCTVGEPVPAVVCAQGIFRRGDGETVAEQAQRAWLSARSFAEMTGKDRLLFAALPEPVRFVGEGGDGVYVLADLLRETAGHLSLSVSVPRAVRAAIVWGEHLTDLRVRSFVGGRNFAIPLRLRAGENVLDDYLHRLGGRYLCLFVEGGEVTVTRLSLRGSLYPFKPVPKHFDDRLLGAIYAAGVRTLQLCAHEHYEDCPWREQGLYGMDSRNQMLYGYGAFREYALPRASLRLMAYSVQEDGLVALCAPARSAVCIPSFSVWWMFALCENAKAAYDAAFVREMLPYAERMLEPFRKRTDRNGVNAFTEPRFWNFHEWSDGLSGGQAFCTETLAPYADGLLTALLQCAVARLALLERREGRLAQAEGMETYAAELAAALERYYEEESGLYATFLRGGKRAGHHVLMQAAAILTGTVPAERLAGLGSELKQAKRCVPCTPAAFQAKYEAIMKADGDKAFCLDEICRVFGGMLFSGATSYWETEQGEADFGDAGSLCHGWAAVACWFLDRYGE